MIRKLVLSLVAVLGVATMSMAQTQVSGRVSGEDGAPIIGATVLVEGTTTGASTGIAGEFTLRAPADGTLVVSFIGYQTQNVPINGQTSIEIVLKEESERIDDVIVVAFGEAKKEAFTGSAAVMKSDDIAKVQTTNALNALSGKVTGVQITNASGQPGNSSPSIIVRGVSSINAGTAPLIVLDGMPYDGSMDSINPNDIESMTVLKDAASNALYGARGANGVIMITTKRAKGRDAIVNVDMRVGVNSRAAKDYDYVDDPGEYYELHYRALYNNYLNSNKSPLEAWQLANNDLIANSASGGLGYNVFTYPASQMLIGQNGKLNPNATLGRLEHYNGQDYWVTPDDWVDEVYGTGVRQEYNASISATTDRSNFYASFGYLNNDGIVEKTNYERYTARLRADFQAKKWLKVGGNVAYTHDSSEYSTSEGDSGSSGNIFSFTSKMAPIYPLYVRDGKGNIMYDENGNIVYDYGDASQPGGNAGFNRPVHAGSNGVGAHMMDVAGYESNALNLSGFADVTFLKDFKFTFNGGIYFSESGETQMTNPWYGQYRTSNGMITKYRGQTFTYNLQQILNYTKQIGKHNINAMIGHENYVATSASLQGNKSNMFSPDMLELPMAMKTVSTSSGSSEYNNEGYFFRAQYEYDGRIFASASYRRDASSRFHPDHRWGNFWSVGAAWLINRENWFKADWVDMLKVKASYGSQGNDNIGSNNYRRTWGVTESEGMPSVSMSGIGNENITWETNGNLNVGFEFEVLKSRLSGNVDYFYRKTTDMLSFFSVAPSAGYSGYYKNVGDMANQGVEIELNGTVIRSKNVNWNINANITYVRNEVLELAEENKTAKDMFDLDGKQYFGYGSGSHAFVEGAPLYSRYGKAYAGVTDKGESMWYMWDIKYLKDANDNLVLDKDGNPQEVSRSLTTTTNFSAADNFVMESSMPEWYGGFGTSIEFYGVDFTANFSYQLGGKVYDGDYAAAMSSPTAGSTGQAYHKDLWNAWTPENPNSDIPRFQFGDQYTAGSSDRFYVSSNYLSLNNLTLGYTFPRKWMSKIGIQRLRIYVACENVWYWSERDGLDPRQSITGGASQAYYSPVRTISGGLNLTF
ncbi:MAG: TonB-dependent receptor [Rikenellaceae bacterium]|nr:TonB-dependent receptor [Rikenellaceae bacterium]